MEVSSIALQGLDRAQDQLNSSAARVAGAGTTASAGMPVDQVDLSKEVVAQMSAKNDFAANLAMLKTADQMQQAAIDMMA
jgi:flagellar hook protein FlgE